MAVIVKKTRPGKLKLFPPWFLAKNVLRKIEALLPYYYHKRFRFYFDRYGCLRCSCKNVIYSCSGLCHRCQALINDRLKRSDRAMKRMYGASPDLPSEVFLRRMTTARELLKDFRRAT